MNKWVKKWTNQGINEQMVPNKEFQVVAIKRLLKQKGLEPDLIDVEAMVDSTLTLSENSRIIGEEVQSIMERKYAPETVSTTKVDNFLKAVDIFEKKTVRSSNQDKNKESKRVFEMTELNNRNMNKWEKNTNRYDIRGVDSKY